MSGYELTESAEDDLRSIFRYITEHDGVDRAEHVQDAFLRVFDAIADMPGIGARRAHLTGDTVRWRTVLGFLILYEPESNPVTIMRIIHGARDFGRMFGDES